MKVCLFIIALVAGMLAFVPTPASADISPCNNCGQVVTVDQSPGS